MSAVARKVLRRLPAGIRKSISGAVHPAQRSRLQRALDGKMTNFGLLSVVIPIYNVEKFLADCLTSVVSQSYPYLEIILVDDGSIDGSLGIAREYARRDRRVKIIELDHGGNGRARNKAVKTAKGQYLTFADSDDVVAPHAYANMIKQIVSSGSDFVVGSSDRLISKKHVPTNLSNRLHARTRIGIEISQFPEILDDVFLWNKLFTRSFWNSKVAPIPEDVLYEDQEATARAFIRADRFDVIENLVYSWRQRPGSTSITQGKADLRNLQDRLTVAHDVSQLILSESNESVAQVFYKRLFGSDLLRYFDLVANMGNEYWEVLSRGSTGLLALFAGQNVISQDTICALDPHSRVFLSLAQDNDRASAESVVVDRQENGTGFEVVHDNGTFTAELNYLTQLGGASSEKVLRCTPESLTFESAVKIRDLRDGRGQILKGHAYIRGLESEHGNGNIRLLVQYSDGSMAEIPRIIVEDPRIDLEANDAFASHSHAGFEAVLAEVPKLEQAQCFVVEFEIGQSKWSGKHRSTLGYIRKLTYEALGNSPQVTDFDVDFEHSEFTISIDWSVKRPSVEVFLSTAQDRIDPIRVAIGDAGRITYTFALFHSRWGRDVLSYPSGAYSLRHRVAESAMIQPIRAATDLVIQTPFEFSLEHTTVTAWATQSHSFAVTLAPPLDMGDRSKYGQRSIHKSFQKLTTLTIEGHFVFESFNGKFCTDSPRALADQLNQQHPNATIYYSITDYSVPYPAYAIPLIRGSRHWAKIVQTASRLINNNNFPFYFRKHPDQMYLQTWHGTPLKKIGLDAPKGLLSASYRTLMRRESDMWDWLLVQNSFSARVLPKAFAYSGSVVQAGYPRNDALHEPGAAERRSWVRKQLGLTDEHRAILYAPTWRDDAFTENGSRKFIGYLDGESIRKNLGDEFVLLNRGHHNTPQSVSEIGANNVIEVSSYPEINDLILASDALVTDYSSIFFDYSITGKPMVFLSPDIRTYQNNTRGFYVDYDTTVPGVILHDAQHINRQDITGHRMISISRRLGFLNAYIQPSKEKSSVDVLSLTILK